MAIYAIGDLQGCLSPFHQLLKIIKFTPGIDQLWLAGDLINRGPDSLAVLRFVKSLGGDVKAVLGNHDIHLLTVAAGIKQEKKRDTFGDILTAPDREELLFWLRHLPLAHKDNSLKAIMIHAGVFPHWGPKKVMRYAHEVEAILQSNSYLDLLADIFPSKPLKWHKSMSSWERYRFISNSLTRMRCLTTNGNLDFNYKGPPGLQPAGFVPWFRHPARRCKKWRLVFGHWAALGHFMEKNLISLDSACVWGGKLTAVQLDTSQNKVWQVGCS